MILNTEQLKARAHEFALTNELRIGKCRPHHVWPTFYTDMDGLRRFAELLSQSRVECTQPAEDWLLDHIDFLEQQAQVVARELPRSTLHQLPRLRGANQPRIYAVCNDYLEQVDGHYDTQSFEAYLQSYQDIAVFKLAECSVLPSAMRVMTIRRLASAMRQVRKHHEVCERVAALLGRLGEAPIGDTQVRALLERETRGRTLEPIEIVHLIQHLSEWEPEIRQAREWLAAHIENSADSLEQMVSFEHQVQAELQVTCGNLVQSLHSLERLPWKATFERIARVEQVLQSDASGDYVRLDAASSARIRQEIAHLADKLRVPEALVAQTTVKLAADTLEAATSVKAMAGPSADLPPRAASLPYYLFDATGVRQLREALSKVARPRRLPQVAVRRRPLSVYLAGTVLLFAGFLLLAGCFVVGGRSIRAAGWIAVFAALALPMSEWAVAMFHELIARCCRSRPLLRYDFSAEVPEDARTMVVMPILWSSTEEVDEVVRRLEVHYLANRQQHIHFAVLADFADADVEDKPEDGDIVAYATQKVQALQQKYGMSRFFLCHRKRQMNATDGSYMGWERKRGKLVEFVDLIGGSQKTSFTTIVGDEDVLAEIKYIFTVDYDTELPIGVVSRLAGTIHLPCNRPRLNENGTRVIEGFGVLQPRIGVSYASTQASRFSALWAGEPGIDPYAFAVSDPYQDMFGQAIFVGKGMFDVHAFAQTLSGRIPDNQVLSHDLLEGGFLRAGLVADVEIVDEHPSTFYAYERRAHRWIRGDWQLAKWLKRRCANRSGSKEAVDLCGLTRWQIIDNLRRSLVTPALLVALLLAITVLPGGVGRLALVLLATLFLPFIRTLVHVLIGRGDWRAVGVSLWQCVVLTLTLPYRAVLMLDAILRTLYRICISRKHLLEWTTSAQVSRLAGKHRVFVDETASYLAIALTVVLGLTIGSSRLIALVLAVGCGVLWLLARPVVQMLNRSRPENRRLWLDAARAELTTLAADTWSFYARYVTADESWLPPDNIQYHPTEMIAHRTSPTNIGLYLTGVVAARDFAFIDTKEMLQRLENTCATLEQLEKWQGHLFNWYDTKTAKPLAPRYVSTVDSGNFAAYLMTVVQALREWSQRDEELSASFNRLADRFDEIVEATQFTALFDVDAGLFSLGYHVDANRREHILYDLLASEARQASFVAIALGQVPVSHWFVLGRTMTLANGHKTLLSWSGTMFEYLLPWLIMRTYDKTIWESTYRGVVGGQYAYAQKQRVPFGISESGYYAFDYQLNYQYKAFGVPGIGFARGMEKDLVIAPYAAIMAMPYAGEKSLKALRRLADFGAKGEFGYYEAVDFTASRLPAGHRHEVIQSFMAHHQGMSLLTLANLLQQRTFVDRFHADARVQATELILQEREPAKAALLTNLAGMHAKAPSLQGQSDEAERQYSEETMQPELNVLSNGRLTSVTTNDGSGFLRYQGLAVTRWREDAVVDSWGPAFYVHDRTTDETWSPTRYPAAAGTQDNCVFRLDKSTFEAHAEALTMQMVVTVATDVDAEVRRLNITNMGQSERTLEITSFYELALAQPSADDAHPAFSKLFVQTSHDKETQSLLAKRRPRTEEEHETWAVHSLFVGGREAGTYEFETDRAAFIGRGYTVGQPQALTAHLRGTFGSVADPAFVMRRSIRLGPNETATVYAITGVAGERSDALAIVRRLAEPAQVERAFHLAWIRTQIDQRHLHLSPRQASVAHLWAARLLFTPELDRNRRRAIVQNQLGQSSLWSRGLSGDAPIAAVRLQNIADLPFVTLLTRQHQYLCALGLDVDLVVLDETEGGYQDETAHRLRDALAARGIAEAKRLFVLKRGALSHDEVNLLFAVTRVCLRANGPSLRAQLRIDDESVPVVQPLPAKESQVRGASLRPPEDGEFFNGWGSFVDDGTAYQIQVQPQHYLPRPWTHVLANPRFGCIMTELGTGYSWWRNASECKLTPWSNDPVLDPPGECLYLQDLDTGDLWSAAAKPAGGERAYTVTHGRGFCRIEQGDGPVAHVMETIVPLNQPLKLIRLTLRNQSEGEKRIALTYYAEWVLGTMRQKTTPFVVTAWDDETNTLLAQNTYQEAFRDAVSFLHIGGLSRSAPLSWTGDRAEFIGRKGSLGQPAGLAQTALSGRTGAFANSCGAISTTVQLEAGEEKSVLVLLGCADSRAEVQALVKRYDSSSAFADVAAEVEAYWDDMLGRVTVRTPDRATDILMNGWLLYQALACRMWGRTAFYQAGGAFGFRDQLQDSLALLHADVSVTRQQILLNAAHQYKAGDVQHWWHEETGKGIRTTFSDDLLWLPYAALRYVEHTGDAEIWQEQVPFLQSEELKADELERYEDTVTSSETGSLLEHCLRAVDHALSFGEHGIPLMGSGDWNDGMSRVGAKGRGESVWLGWFLLNILKRFCEWEPTGIEQDRLMRYRQVIRDLTENMNRNAWDGAWFRRAFTDAGTWLGSIEDKECRIDAIAQSWSVISDGAPKERQERALRSFDRELVEEHLSLAKLLTPAFDETRPSPGYIQGYPPGIRENGGQYTHGVIWSIIAWALLERRDKAFHLFSMLNPIHHTMTPGEVLTYGDEPYVMSADVYTATPHEGRAGWSWYTGAAGWMYQAGLEYVLGVSRRGNRLYVRPCVPASWHHFSLSYRVGETTYEIEVDCTAAGNEPVCFVVDGTAAANQDYLTLEDDGRVHTVMVTAARTEWSEAQ